MPRDIEVGGVGPQMGTLHRNVRPEVVVGLLEIARPVLASVRCRHGHEGPEVVLRCIDSYRAFEKGSHEEHGTCSRQGHEGEVGQERLLVCGVHGGED